VWLVALNEEIDLKDENEDEDPDETSIVETVSLGLWNDSNEGPSMNIKPRLKNYD